MNLYIFLRATAQTGTFWIGFAMQALGGIVLTLAVNVDTGMAAAPFFALLMGGIALVFGGFAWNCLRILCPNCRSRVYWEVVRRAPASSWFSGDVEGVCSKCAAQSLPLREG